MAAAQGMQAISTAGNTYSQYGATLGQGRFQTSIYNQNAQLAEQQALNAEARGSFQSNVRGLQTQQTIGKQRVALAGNAVNVNTGSAAQIQQDTAAAGAIDQANIKQNAALTSWGYRMEAIDSRTRGQMTKIGARSSANSSLISGGMAFARDAMGAAYYGSKAGSPAPDMVDQAGFGYWGK